VSRTRHHRSKKHQKCGVDFGARYKCNKGYGGGCGPDAKNAADSDRRIEAKHKIETGLIESNEQR